MCGIAGFIGHSKNHKLTFRLITALFEESQIRGIDAAGYWGTEVGDGSIVYHKEPIKASDFVKKAVWRDLIELDINMLLVHARGASTGVGLPSENKNNHPFTSTCKSIGLIHNGRIPDLEYDVLTKRYEVASKCDSELLLRIFEGGQHYSKEECVSILEEEDGDSYDVYSRLMGLRDIWSFIDKGHMAVAIGERIDAESRRLFLFRNKHRSLWLADLRDELGQVFFCSTPDIWNSALRNSGLSRILKNRVKMVELPTQELWMLSCDNQEPHISNIKKYDICNNGRLMWKPPEGEKIKINHKTPATSVLTKLDEQEDILCSTKKEKARLLGPKGYDYDDDELVLPINGDDDYYGDNFTIEDVNSSCNSIRKMLDDLYEAAAKKFNYGVMSSTELKELLKELESIELQLDGSIRLIKR